MAVVLVMSISLNVVLFMTIKKPTISTQDYIQLSKGFNKLIQKEKDAKILGLISKNKPILSFSNSSANECDRNLSYAEIYFSRVESLYNVASLVGDMSDGDTALLQAYTGALNEMLSRLEGCEGMISGYRFPD